MSKKITISIGEAVNLGILDNIKEKIQEVKKDLLNGKPIDEKDIKFIKFMAEQLKIKKVG